MKTAKISVDNWESLVDHHIKWKVAVKTWGRGRTKSRAKDPLTARQKEALGKERKGTIYIYIYIYILILANITNATKIRQRNLV